MPTTAIVARSSVKLKDDHHTSFPPKLSNTCRRPANTTNVSRLAQTISQTGATSASALLNKNSKPDPVKSDPVSTDLSPKTKPAAQQSIKTLLRHPSQAAIPVEEEVQLEEPENTVELSTTPVATQPELEVAADDVPLYDVQQFYNSEQFTPIVEEVWKYLTGPTPAKSHMEFAGVGPREFELIEYAVRETGRVATKPRLTYDYIEHLLVIDMPTVLHEAFYDDLKKSFTFAMDYIPYHRRTINPQVHMNYPLQITDKSVTPDMAISLTARQGPTEVLIIPFVGETAVTEEWDHVFRKVESMIEEYPEAIFASIVLVREARRYVCPARKSTASKTLHNRKPDDLPGEPHPLSLKSFINKRSTPRTFEQPVRIANHTWCHVQSVEYFLWIKGDDDKPIDMRNGKAEHRAHGTLVPELRMDAITKLLDRGMEKLRDLFFSFQKECDHTSTIDHSVVQKFVNPPFPIDWELSAFNIMSAVDLTAHLRYLNWHSARFRDSKQDGDSSYEPLEAEEGANANPALTRSKRRRRPSKAPPPQTFHSIAMVPDASISNHVAAGSSSKPKKDSAGKPRPSKGAKTSRGGHSGKGPNKLRKV